MFRLMTIGLVSMFFAGGAGMAVAQPPSAPSSAPAEFSIDLSGIAAIAIVDFVADAEMDERDGWAPGALQEMLCRRLRRIPKLTLIPQVRLYQGRRELHDDTDGPAPEWRRVAELLGARTIVSARCSGNPDALRIAVRVLALNAGSADREIAKTEIGPGRVLDVLDDATRWLLGVYEIRALDREMEKLVFERPASASALEYYAKALAAAREGNMSDAGFNAQLALDYDARFRPALMLLAKIHLRVGVDVQTKATMLLRRYLQLARIAGDPIDPIEFHLALGLISLGGGQSDQAEESFHAALKISQESGAIYGALGAMNDLCDLWLTRAVPRGQDSTPTSKKEFDRQRLEEAARWQTRVLETLRALGDVVSQTPATNKLALIYERLDQPERAQALHLETIKTAEKTGARRSQATGWMFLGLWHHHQEQLEPAAEAMKKCLVFASERGKPVARIALADIYRDMKQPEPALREYKQAYAALELTDELPSQMRCLRRMAELHEQLGQKSDAVRCLRDALDIAKALQSEEEKAIRAEIDRVGG